MDKLQVIQAAQEKAEKEQEGKGKKRREAIERLMIYARDLGCQIEAGGGRVGGINFRYGSIGYAIMDISTEGDVKVYAQPHPNKEAPAELHDKISEYLEKSEQLTLKSKEIKCHGLLNAKVEDIPREALIEFLEVALQAIKDTYYK